VLQTFKMNPEISGIKLNENIKISKNYPQVNSIQ
jgi:hypothetical protein